MVWIGRRVRTSLNSFAGSYGMMDQTWKEAQVEEGHLTILNRVIKDRRALRNVTQMKTEILFEILHLDIWLIAIGNAVIHKAPGKEDIEHILWLVSPCE